MQVFVPIGVVARCRSKDICRCIMTVGALRSREPGHAADDSVEEARDDAVDGSGGSSHIIWADIITCQTQS